MIKKGFDKSHKGQTIILFMVSLVAMLAFAALAVEGGALYANRRATQNAADAAALAGGYAKCYGEDPVAKALSVAQSNGYVNDANNTVIVNNPPVSGSHSGNEDFVEVIITSRIPSRLVQLVFGGDLENTARAVGSCYIMSGGLPHALWVMDPHACNALTVDGGASVDTLGAGVYVNSDGDGGSCPAASAGGGGYISGGEHGVRVVGYTETSGGSVIVEPLYEYADLSPDPLYYVLVPPLAACSGPALDHNSGSSTTINPGHYSQIKQTGGTLTFNPGVYCIDATSDQKGLEGGGGAVIEGSEVLIYLKRGSIVLGGIAYANLSAPTEAGCSGLTCDYIGLLIYSDQNNTGASTQIKLTGGTGSNYTGTVYAASNPVLISGGSLDSGFNIALFCKTLAVSGTGTLNLQYNAAEGIEVNMDPVINLSE